MRLDLALLLYVAGLCVASPRLLTRGRWLRRMPRLGVLLWQAAGLGTVGALVLLPVAALLPVDRFSLDLPHLVHACLHPWPPTPVLSPAGFMRLAALLIAGATTLRLAWVLVRQVRRAWSRRRQQREALGLLVGSADDDGVHLLEANLPLAYSVPGRGGRIVLTSSAASELTPPQRAAVIAHERAHLSGRHDLVLLAAEVSGRALGRLRLFSVAAQQLPVLVEMVADDAAARRTHPQDVAAALQVLNPTARAAAGQPAVSALKTRLARLLDPEPVPGVRLQLVPAVLGVVVGVAPWVTVVVPVLAAVSGRCPNR